MTMSAREKYKLYLETMHRKEFGKVIDWWPEYHPHKVHPDTEIGVVVIQYDTGDTNIFQVIEHGEDAGSKIMQKGKTLPIQDPRNGASDVFAD